MHSSGRFVSILILISWFPAGGAIGADHLYLGDRFGQVVMEVEVASGNRRLFELEDYPDILSARSPLPDGPGSFLFYASDAAQLPALRRYHIATGSHEGISGFTDFNSQTPRGTGPQLNLKLADLIQTQAGSVLGLHLDRGPMEIDLDSGDRRLLASEIAPVTGADPPLLEALDLVLETSTTVLIADRFQGIFRMNRITGDLEIAYPSTDFLSSPYNLERLPDGRLVHALSQADSALYIFDPVTREDRYLSTGGPFPIGSGDPFVTVWDVTIDSSGRIYVYDLGIPAVFEVNLKSGDRTLISSQARGTGPPLLGDFSLPSISAGIVTGAQASFWVLR